MKKIPSSALTLTFCITTLLTAGTTCFAGKHSNTEPCDGVEQHASCEYYEETKMQFETQDVIYVGEPTNSVSDSSATEYKLKIPIKWEYSSACTAAHQIEGSGKGDYSSVGVGHCGYALFSPPEPCYWIEKKKGCGSPAAALVAKPE